MAALFPRWTNTAYRLGLAALSSTSVALLGALMLFVRSPWNNGQYQALDQPVQFDHRHHVVDDEIPCVYCHRGAQVSEFAGVPATEVCMGCHAQIWNDSPLLEPVRRSFFSGKPLLWNRVHALPDFVYFNHAVHVRRGVGCVTCHGHVEQMARVYPVAPLTMSWCLDCHRNASDFADWRQSKNVEFGTPEDHLFGSPDVQLKAVKDRRRITSLTTCSACHR